MDTVIRGGIVVTCDAEDSVRRADLLVRGGRIAAIGEGASVDQRLLRVVDARECAVIPGFVQAHVHLAQTLFRGMADDLPLLDWLRHRIWPLEAAHDARSLGASAELGLLELMGAGTTTLLDMGTVRDYGAVFAACFRSGVRAIGGKAMMDAGSGLPRALRESTRASLEESVALADAWSGKGGRIGYAFAPRFVLCCTEGLVRGAVAAAKRCGALLHTHAAEHADEDREVHERFGVSDIALLARWGCEGPRAILAHGVQVDDRLAQLLAEAGTRVVHCPSANLKLGSGIAPIAALDRAGVSLALGADGAPCNNNLDPWVELRHAALLAQIRSGPGSLSARRALRLATIDGARALGLDAVTGSLEVGKEADLAVVRLDGAHVLPCGDVVGMLVYACHASDVTHVMVRGELVVRGGEHQRLDGERVRARAKEQARLVRRRANL